MTPLDEKRIAKLHPVLGAKCRQHLELCEKAGVQFRIAQGFRSRDDQAALWAKGRSPSGTIVRPSEVVTFSPPGRSWHEYGLAYDLVQVLKDGTSVSWDLAMDGDMDGIRDWQEMGVIGESLGLEWGGRWKKLKDYPHFQLTGKLTLEQAWMLTAKGDGIPDSFLTETA